MVSFVESTISFFSQIVVLGMLTAAFVLRKKKEYRRHGVVMLYAVALHLVSILVVMVPSFVAFLGGLSSISFADFGVATAFIHVFSGLFAAVLGIWLVGSWRLQESFQKCFRKKRVMDLALGVWLVAIALGIVLYMLLIVRM